MLQETVLCTGCGVCALRCPEKCITMKENDEGFLYPSVDTKKCTNCGLCDKVCHLNAQKCTDNYKQKVFAGINLDSDTLFKSSSGGIFSALAEKIIDTGGAVYGCAFDSEFIPSHIKIEKKSDLFKLHGSKYVESYLGNIFEDVKKTVDSGRNVLFSGTGCQTAALLSYLGGREYPNLFTLDIICHGVPSRRLFKHHLNWLSNRGHGEVKDFSFRCKSPRGGGTHLFQCGFQDGTVQSGPYFKDPYYFSFMNSAIFRESCYLCKYAQSKRVGDITLGDYWGVENHHKLPGIKKGVSLVIVNSKKGENLLSSCAGGISLIPSKLEWACEGNQNLVHPVSRPALRETIYKTIENDSYEKWANSYFSSKKYLLLKLKSFIPVGIKKSLKRLVAKKNNAVCLI